MWQPRALIAGLTMPLEAKGFQRLKDIVRGAWDFTGWIEVFDTNQPFPVSRYCLEVATDGSYQ